MSDADSGFFERFLPGRIRRSYAAKFNVVLLVVVLVVAAAGGFIHLQTQASVGEDTRSEVSGTAEQQAASLHDWVVQKEATARFLASGLGGDSVWASDVEPQLERELATLQENVLAIHVVSTGTNSVVASTDDARSGESLSSEDVPWYDTISDGSSDVQMSDPYRVGGEPVVAVTAPTDKTGWVLVMTVSLADQSQSFNSPIATGDVKVVGDDGTITFDNRNRALLEPYTDASGEVPEAVATARGGETVFEVDGERTGMSEGQYATAYAPVTGTDWVLAYHVPRGEAYALQSQVTQNLAGLVVVALVGVLLVGLTVGRRTSNALDELSGVASAVAEGDLDTDVPETDRTDELGQLVESFQGMQTYLGTAASQADALAEQNFDADVLEEDLPGSFGASLSQMHTRLEALITDLDETRKDAEDARRESERLNERLETRAASFSDEMAAAAAGDLTRRLDEDAESEPMRNIAAAFNDMMDDVEATLSQVRAIADAVDAASTDVSTSSAEMRNASDQVSDSVQDISADADRQRDRLGTVGDEITSLSATVEEIAASADDVAETVDEAATESERGQALGEDAVAELERIEATADSAVERVNALEEAVDAIGEVTGVITNIAEQTNMLALNANIEAARADKSGDGFAVVADEVKDLADETKESAAEIEGLVEDVQDDVESTVEDMAELGDRVDAGSETIEAALSALSDIGGRVEEANASVQSISEATDEQAASTEEVVTMTDEVEDLSDRTATEAQQVSAAAEEQAASVSEVAGLADELDGQVSELNALLAQFETREELRDEVAVTDRGDSPADDGEAVGSGDPAGDGEDTSDDAPGRSDDPTERSDDDELPGEDDSAAGDDPVPEDDDLASGDDQAAADGGEPYGDAVTGGGPDDEEDAATDGGFVFR